MAGRFAKAWGSPDIVNADGRWSGNVEFVEEKLREPLSWKEPQRIFVNSMSDLFHEKVPDEWIDRILAVVAAAPRHTFQVLTKRPERMLAYFKGNPYQRILDAVNRLPTRQHDAGISDPNIIPWRQLWLGVSVEDQKAADERIPLLLRTPAAVRWVSAEPLLGQIDLRPAPLHQWPDGTRWMPNKDEPDDWKFWTHKDNCIKWVVVGGESGHGARPMSPKWAHDLRDQCVAAGVPFFFKQWGAWGPRRGQGLDRQDRAYGEFHADGSWIESCLCSDGAYDMLRTGKREAGRTLDGRTWDEYPQAKAVAA